MTTIEETFAHVNWAHKEDAVVGFVTVNPHLDGIDFHTMMEMVLDSDSHLPIIGDVVIDDRAAEDLVLHFVRLGRELRRLRLTRTVRAFDAGTHTLVPGATHWTHHVLIEGDRETICGRYHGERGTDHLIDRDFSALCSWCLGAIWNLRAWVPTAPFT